MTKGRNTTPVAFRLNDTDYFAIKEKASKKGLSVGVFLKQLALKEALRVHKKQEVQP